MSLTPDTRAEKFVSFERINSMLETVGVFDTFFHVNGWKPAVYMRYACQNFRLFHASNLSVRNFLIFTLMYPVSLRISTHRTAVVPNVTFAACRSDGLCSRQPDANPEYPEYPVPEYVLPAAGLRLTCCPVECQSRQRCGLTRLEKATSTEARFRRVSVARR